METEITDTQLLDFVEANHLLINALEGRAVIIDRRGHKWSEQTLRDAIATVMKAYEIQPQLMKAAH